MSTLQQPAPGALLVTARALVPDPDQPGLGLQLRTADAEALPADVMHADLPRGCATQTLPPSNPLRRTDR